MLERYHSQRSVLEPDLILSQPESTKKIDILQYCLDLVKIEQQIVPFRSARLTIHSYI